MRRGRGRERVWGSSGGDRALTAPAAAGLALAVLAAFVGLGFLMAFVLRAGVAGGSPLLTALCLGGMMLAFLSTSVVLLRLAARRLTAGGAARHAVTIGGLAVLMGFAPFLMILVVYLLARGGSP